MSYASSRILLQLIIIPQPQSHYGLLALNKQRRMVVEVKVRVRVSIHTFSLMTVKRKHVKHINWKHETVEQISYYHTQAKRTNINKDR